MAERIQRKRSKGWRMPENTVSVCRPGVFGNPFSVLPNRRAGSRVGGAMGYLAVPTVEDAIECFELYLKEKPELVELIKKELRGKNLACWCSLDKPCHADTLIRIANEEGEPQ